MPKQSDLEAEVESLEAVVEDLEDQLERYRRAAEDALQLLDWSIGYLHGCRKDGEARTLAQGRQTIRRNLLHRDDVPAPA